jgi:curved DNA-binding protein CbpA
MVNYYKVLKVSPKASNTEIKSAYRRLARKLHPDINNDPDNTSAEFTKITAAYNILGNPQERANYDKQLLKVQYKTFSQSDSVLSSENTYARRWRQMAYERRYNEIIDRMIADERRESMALQKIIFPLVALFLSTCFVAIFKPSIFINLHPIGKIVLVSLFVIGLVHLFSRLKTAFEKYTYSGEDIHDSILEKTEIEQKPYTRLTAICFLICGFCISLAAGILIGNYLQFFTIATMPSFFSSTLKPEFVFYPPIFVLLVDAMHAFASRLE